MEKLKELRKLRGLTIADLAAKIGVSMHSVFRWEHNISSPKARELKCLADVLNTTPNELLGIEEIKTGIKK